MKIYDSCKLDGLKKKRKTNCLVRGGSPKGFQRGGVKWISSTQNVTDLTCRTQHPLSNYNQKADPD